MNGLFIIIGESFRIGEQNTRIRGIPKSYKQQIGACKTHIKFLKHIKLLHKINRIDIVVSTYTTIYDNELINIYKEFLIHKNIYDDVIGLDNLFHESFNNNININNYDFIFYFRIDLYLKNNLFNKFNPNSQMILFPSICWKKGYKLLNYEGSDSVLNGYPRVNDTMLFIPKKYFNIINEIYIGHETWGKLIISKILIIDDLDCILNTYHDSDTSKDFNPLYFIVNRTHSCKWHSKDLIFDKYNFN